MSKVHAQKLGAYWLTSVGSLAMQYSFSVIFVDLLVAFDSTRAATAAVGSLSAGLMDGFGVISGRAIARRGEVVCGSLGALLSGLGLIASSQCKTLWQLYVTYGIVLGVGQSLGLYSGVIACNKWFPENTALASGFANSGAGVGPFAIPFLWAALKRETNGWRGALAALGAMVFAVLFAGALGLAPPPPSSEKRAPVSPIAVSAVPGVRRLMRTTFIFGFGFWIPAVHIVRYGLDRDLSRRRAESLLLYLGAGALTMRVPVGALADRCGRSRVYSAVCLTYAVALAVTPVWERSYEGLAVFSVLCGSCIGSLLSLSATLVVDVREVKDPDALARASGLICAFLGVGGTLGPVIAGAFYDAYETYLPGFYFGAGALALAAISVHVEAKPPDEATTTNSVVV
mmetsp:Transcript_5605/g.14188  ORF Transcript_5605/g.14188 Transcript_5605/m.14188 type:complete len:400 (-) Transcript_5605:24-1223(-)